MTAPGTSREHLPECPHGCDRLTAQLSYTIHSMNQAEPLVAEVVELATRTFGEESGKGEEVGLSLQEALANGVMHGNGGDPAKSVRCWVALQNGGMTIVVRDEGPGFDPDAVPNPRQGEALTFDHGRGIYLIRQLMQDVHFTRNGAEIHMSKR